MRAEIDIQKFTDLDGMRGILSVFIMLYHYGLNTVINRVSGGVIAHANWALCVDFFFILSGFVLARSLQPRLVSTWSFIKRRSARLLPVHLFIIIIFFPFLYTHIGPDLSNIGLNLLLLQSTFLQPSINGPSWSAGFELILPIFAVIVWPKMKKSKILFQNLLLLGLFLVASLLAYSVALRLSLDFGRAVCGIGLGFMLYLGERNLTFFHFFGQGAVWTYLYFSLVIFCIVLSSLIPSVALFFPLFSILAILSGCKSKTFLSSGIPQWFGRCSYTIYMVHVPIFVTAIVILGDDALTGKIFGKATLVGLCLLFAHIITVFIEQPFIRMSKSGVTAEQPPGARG